MHNFTEIITYGTQRITRERERQVRKGRSIPHDNTVWPNGELTLFAIYNLLDNEDAEKDNYRDWLISGLKMEDRYLRSLDEKPWSERLAISGALIAAEIDRLHYNERNETNAGVAEDS